MKKWRALLVVAVVVLSFAFATQAFAVTIAIDMPDGAYQASTTKIDISAIADTTSVGSITDGVLTATFSSPMTKYSVPTWWQTWSAPPFSESATPDVLYSQVMTQTITLNKPVATLGFEIEGVNFIDADYTVTFKISLGDVQVGQVVKTINGLAGARLIAIRALDGVQQFDKVEIVATDAFAIAQVRYAPCPEGAFSISADLTPQQVCLNLPVAIKVHPTIQMDTSVDYLEYNCANPLTNSTVSLAFDWVVKSNVPWWKRIEATSLGLGTYDEATHTWTTPPGQGYVFDSLEMDPLTGYPTGGIKPVALNDVVAADRIKLALDGVAVSNPFWSGVIGDADTHEDTERVDYTVDFNWCDTAGWYGGYVWLCAFQN